jgi:hypothetical protein
MMFVSHCFESVLKTELSLIYLSDEFLNIHFRPSEIFYCFRSENSVTKGHKIICLVRTTQATSGSVC